MNKIKFVRIVLLILIIAWAILIFSLSGQDGGSSSGLSRRLVEFFIRNNENLVDIVEPYIRKVAHFCEYGVGGILIPLYLFTYKWSDKKILISSLPLGVWYAILDEVHQALVPGRHAGIEDILIDSLGFAEGVIGIFIIIKIIEKIKGKTKIKA